MGSGLLPETWKQRILCDFTGDITSPVYKGLTKSDLESSLPVFCGVTALKCTPKMQKCSIKTFLLHQLLGLYTGGEFVSHLVKGGHAEV